MMRNVVVPGGFVSERRRQCDPMGENGMIDDVDEAGVGLGGAESTIYSVR